MIEVVQQSSELFIKIWGLNVCVCMYVSGMYEALK